MTGKDNLVKKLRKTYAEALAAYPKVHAEFEQIIRKAEQVVSATNALKEQSLFTKLEFYLEGTAKVRRMGFDPHDAVVDLSDPESLAEDSDGRYPPPSRATSKRSFSRMISSWMVTSA
ncbi:MAG: hypothetical protein CTR54_17780 [Rhizobium sp.]|nr:MAG: hypothetical protein CTR54_17780 [Rhizobium sp.]